MAYIYQIINDVNQKKYIGKTEFSIDKRFKEHCSDSQKERCKNRPLYRAMNKYGIEHFHIELIEETGNPEEREQYWIERYKTFKYGYNATVGGDGRKYLDYDLIIKLYSKLQNIAKVAEIINCSVDHVSDILHYNKIQVLSAQEVSKRINSKPIAKCDKLTHKIIEVYNSCHEAERSLGIKNSNQHISQCANGKRKSAYGYWWKYI